MGSFLLFRLMVSYRGPGCDSMPSCMILSISLSLDPSPTLINSIGVRYVLVCFAWTFQFSSQHLASHWLRPERAKHSIDNKLDVRCLQCAGRREGSVRADEQAREAGGEADVAAAAAQPEREGHPAAHAPPVPRPHAGAGAARVLNLALTLILTLTLTLNPNRPGVARACSPVCGWLVCSALATASQIKRRVVEDCRWPCHATCI